MLRDGIVPKLDLTATEADFEAVLNLTEPLYRHACHILSILPATDVQQREPTPQEALFDALPLASTAKRRFMRQRGSAWVPIP